MRPLLLQLFVFRSFVGDPDPIRKGRSSSSEREAGASDNNTRKWLVIGWAAITAKCAALWWLIEKYQVPIHPLWLVGPTLLFGLLATAVYIWRT